MSVKTLSIVALLAAVAAGEEGSESMLTLPKTGEFWYRMQNAEGEPCGFARMRIEERDGGGVSVAWELKITFQGGSYEEERHLELGADGRLLAGDYLVKGTPVAEGRREGEVWHAVVHRDGEAVVTKTEITDDTCTGMGFVLAAMLPQEEGARLERTEIDEGKGFEVQGKAAIVCTGSRTRDLEGTEIEVFAYDVKWANGKTLPVLVDAQRRIVWTDWGGGTVMTLSAKETTELFRPPAPAVHQVDTPADTLVLRGDFPGFPPEELYDHFTQPELLKRWWPQEAEVELEVGGRYHLSWPQQKWHLRGAVRACERGRRFDFTWRWEHMPDAPETVVSVAFEKAGSGTRLTITHGPYDADDPGRQRERAGHLRGWIQVLGRLKALR